MFRMRVALLGAALLAAVATAASVRQGSWTSDASLVQSGARRLRSTAHVAARGVEEELKEKKEKKADLDTKIKAAEAEGKNTLDQIKKLEDEFANMATKIANDPKEKEKHEVRLDVARVQGELKTVNADIATLQKQVQAFATKYQEVEDEFRSLNSQMNELAVQQASENRTADRLADVKAEREKQIESVRAEQRRADNDLRNVTETNAAREQKLQKAISEVSTTAASLEAEVEKLKAALEELKQRIANQLSSITVHQQKLDTETERTHDLEGRLERSIESREQLTKQLEEHRTMLGEAKAGYEVAEAALQKLHNSTDVLRVEVKTLTTEYRHLTELRSNATDEVDKLEENTDRLAILIDEANGAVDMLHERVNKEREAIEAEKADHEETAAGIASATKAIRSTLTRLHSAVDSREAAHERAKQVTAARFDLVRTVARLAIKVGPEGASGEDRSCPCALITVEEAEEAGLDEPEVMALAKCQHECERRRFCGEQCKRNRAAREAAAKKAEIKEKAEEVAHEAALDATEKAAPVANASAAQEAQAAIVVKKHDADEAKHLAELEHEASERRQGAELAAMAHQAASEALLRAAKALATLSSAAAEGNLDTVAQVVDTTLKAALADAADALERAGQEAARTIKPGKEGSEASRNHAMVTSHLVTAAKGISKIATAIIQGADPQDLSDAEQEVQAALTEAATVLEAAGSEAVIAAASLEAASSGADEEGEVETKQEKAYSDDAAKAFKEAASVLGQAADETEKADVAKKAEELKSSHKSSADTIRNVAASISAAVSSARISKAHEAEAEADRANVEAHVSTEAAKSSSDVDSQTENALSQVDAQIEAAKQKAIAEAEALKEKIRQEANEAKEKIAEEAESTKEEAAEHIEAAHEDETEEDIEAIPSPMPSATPSPAPSPIYRGLNMTNEDLQRLIADAVSKARPSPQPVADLGETTLKAIADANATIAAANAAMTKTTKAAEDSVTVAEAATHGVPPEQAPAAEAEAEAEAAAGNATAAADDAVAAAAAADASAAEEAAAPAAAEEAAAPAAAEEAAAPAAAEEAAAPAAAEEAAAPAAAEEAAAPAAAEDDKVVETAFLQAKAVVHSMRRLASLLKEEPVDADSVDLATLLSGAPRVRHSRADPSAQGTIAPVSSDEATVAETNTSASDTALAASESASAAASAAGAAANATEAGNSTEAGNAIAAATIAIAANTTLDAVQGAAASAGNATAGVATEPAANSTEPAANATSLLQAAAQRSHHERHLRVAKAAVLAALMRIRATQDNATAANTTVETANATAASTDAAPSANVMAGMAELAENEQRSEDETATAVAQAVQTAAAAAANDTNAQVAAAGNASAAAASANATAGSHMRLLAAGARSQGRRLRGSNPTQESLSPADASVADANATAAPAETAAANATEATNATAAAATSMAANESAVPQINGSAIGQEVASAAGLDGPVHSGAGPAVEAAGAEVAAEDAAAANATGAAASNNTIDQTMDATASALGMDGDAASADASQVAEATRAVTMRFIQRMREGKATSFLQTLALRSGALSRAAVMAAAGADDEDAMDPEDRAAIIKAELTGLTASIKKLGDDLEAAKKRAAEYTKELNTKQAKKAEFDALNGQDIDTLKSTQETLNKALSSQSAIQTDLTSSRDSTRMQLESAQAKVRDAESKVASLTSGIERLKRVQKSLQDAIDRMKEEKQTVAANIEATRDRAGNEKSAGLERKLEMMKHMAEQEERKDEATAVRNKLAEAEAVQKIKAEALQHRITQLEEYIEGQKQNQTELSDKITAEVDRISQLSESDAIARSKAEEAKEKTDEAEQEATETRAAEQDLRAVKQQMLEPQARLKADLARARTAIKEHSIKRDELLATSKTLDAELNSVRAKYSKLNRTLHTLRDSNSHLHAELRHRNATAKHLAELVELNRHEAELAKRVVADSKARIQLLETDLLRLQHMDKATADGMQASHSSQVLPAGSAAEAEAQQEAAGDGLDQPGDDETPEDGPAAAKQAIDEVVNGDEEAPEVAVDGDMTPAEAAGAGEEQAASEMAKIEKAAEQAVQEDGGAIGVTDAAKQAVHGEEVEAMSHAGEEAEEAAADEQADSQVDGANALGDALGDAIKSASE
ncbi:hypothetical protein FNF27_03907 [Cafeteria roenbergensis]|uniref:Methyl-accepting transducer domain-containing protein n=1 Tax=Cafeteria roenbergensis TaxID=33653 RepID=A0A5A8E9L9_CAFRO|nr:hypothetical protein FNF27_03907 [Cafeteria roenbergensis]